MSSDGFGLGGEIDIAEGVRISEYVMLAPFGGKIRIGKNVYIGSNCSIFGHGPGTTIGSDVMIASHVTIFPVNHGFSERDTPMRNQAGISLGIIIKDDVWIGTGARILDGVTLGKGCIVAAGAVVNRSVPDFTIVAGVPAKTIGIRGGPDKAA
jgi:acetyltransferase-like isoleucine patch superfamily enzyme